MILGSCLNTLGCLALLCFALSDNLALVACLCLVFLISQGDRQIQALEVR